MTHDEFVRQAIGIPWARWRSDWQCCDCYGLIVLYYREVMGINLPDVPKTDLAEGLPQVLPRFVKIDKPSTGACGFMAFRDGNPTHCGIYIGGDLVMHSHGSDGVAGGVRICRLATLRKIYGEIEFYAVAN